MMAIKITMMMIMSWSWWLFSERNSLTPTFALRRHKNNFLIYYYWLKYFWWYIIGWNIFDQNIFWWKYLPTDIYVSITIPIVTNVKPTKTTKKKTDGNIFMENPWCLYDSKSLRNFSEKTKQPGELRPWCRPVVYWGDWGELGRTGRETRRRPPPATFNHPPPFATIHLSFWAFVGFFGGFVFSSNKNPKHLRKKSKIWNLLASTLKHYVTKFLSGVNHLLLCPRQSILTCSWVNILVRGVLTKGPFA